MWVMCSKTSPEAPAGSEGKNSTSQYWDFYWKKKEVKTTEWWKSIKITFTFMKKDGLWNWSYDTEHTNLPIWVTRSYNKK